MRYPGGKNSGGAYQTVINQIPPHRVYIEPFLGSGAVMRFKKPAAVTIGIERDSTAILSFCTQCVNTLPEEAKLFRIRQGDGIEFLSNYRFRGDEFIYCDPPYMIEPGRQRYKFRFTERDHKRLLKILKRIPSPVAVSGYPSALYSKELADWRSITYPAMTRGGVLSTEVVWFNYALPRELHDYRYLGENKTERQRIKRKCQRWERRLAEMPRLERLALLCSIEKAWGQTAQYSGFPLPCDLRVS